MVPVVARLEAWLPFTYSRSVAPSYVSARCDQRFTGTARRASACTVLPSNAPPPAGNSGSALELLINLAPTPRRTSSAPSNTAYAETAQRPAGHLAARQPSFACR